MKRLAILCGALLSMTVGVSAQTYFNYDFEEGIPSGFTLIDNDQNVPNADAAELGFEVGKPWIAIIPPQDENMAASATSWYENGGTSDDWMILPAFTVEDDGVMLSWRARSRNKRVLECYSVYVSETGGNAIADFDLANPLFTTTGEKFAWSYHNVDLNAYKGKTISIAFVDNTTNKGCIYIDDIMAGVYSPLQVKSNLDGRTLYGGDVKFSGEVTNVSPDVIEGYTVTVTSGEDVVTMAFDKEIIPGEVQEFEMAEGIHFGFNETRDYEMTVSTGNMSYSIEGKVTSYQRKVVCEEITGSWCQWCVRGAYALDCLRMEHKDTSIGIAVHGGDPMQSNYTTSLFSLFPSLSGYPNGVIGRLWIGYDPLMFESYVGASLEQEKVAVAIKPEVVVDYNSSTLNTKTYFAFADSHTSANFRVLYAVIENNVHHPGNSDYSQQNAYGGGSNGEMGGWEKFGGVISSSYMWYHDVARYYDQDINGIAGLLPAEIVGGEILEVEHNFSVASANIDNLHNCELVVMIIDGEDSHIINAEKVALDENAEEPVDVVANAFGGGSGVENIVIEETDAEVEGFYNLEGVRLAAPCKGINIVKLSNGSTRKIFVK